MKQEENVATVKTMFAEMAHKDVEAWISHWADEGSRQLIPYAPEDFPKIVEGKETLRTVYRDLLAGYGELVYTHIDVLPMANPDKVLVEWGVDIELPASKSRYQNELIGMFSFKDGKVIELKEYFNPDNFRKAIAR
jgi:ketosteroid isomerase-like protein